jgi:hypothetical protein
MGAGTHNNITGEFHMKILGVDGLTSQQVQDEVAQGGRFVMYQYCISIIVMTFRRTSNIYFLKAGQGAIGKGVGFTLISLLLGWWGIPWGPIYTVQTLWVNFRGGRDVTQEVLAENNAPAAAMPLPQT